MLAVVLGWMACAIPVPATVAAQAPTPTLAPDHWAVGALRRLDAAGLLPPGSDWARRTPREAEVVRAFAHAALQAVADGSSLTPLVVEWGARFAREAGTVPLPLVEPGLALRATAAGGFRERSGVVLAGVGYDNVPDWTGAEPAPDTATWFGALEGAGRYGDRLAAVVAVEGREGGVRLTAGEAVLRLGSFHLWGGRRTVGMGPGSGGAIVLSGTTFDGGGVAVAVPATLPGFLEYLGPVSAETFFSRVENGDRVTDPWFWATRVALSPHPRFGLGFTRGDMIGGRGNTPVTLKYLLQALVGDHAGERGEFNSITAGLDARWRPPLGALPLRLWVEWGFDDGAGAISDSPANVFGAELAAVPGIPRLALGLERTWFHPDCQCGNTVWYRNWWFRGGWTDERRPLGHPLGGDGTEWRGEARLDLHRATLDVNGWTRERGPVNLFAPEREGQAVGGAVGVDVQLREGWQLRGAFHMEEGRDADWRERFAEVRLSGRM